MEPLLAPLAGAVASGIATLVVLWINARSRSGRFGRTIENVKRLNELVQQYVDITAKLPPERKEELEAIMIESLRSARSEFEAEQTILPRFEKNASSSASSLIYVFRRALLFFVPQRGWVWLPLIVFQSSLALLMVLFLQQSVTDHPWQPPAINLAVSAAALALCMRLLAALDLKPN
jgi:hypothetical protein